MFVKTAVKQVYSAKSKLRLPISCLRVEKYASLAFATHANTGVLAQVCEKDNSPPPQFPLFWLSSFVLPFARQRSTTILEIIYCEKWYEEHWKFE